MHPKAWLHAVGLPFTWLLVGLIRAYQYLISPMISPSCRFYPSCSAYGVDALKTHGPVKGVLLTTARLCRCNPFSGGGLNPVPPKGAWRPEINPDGTPRADRGTGSLLMTDAGA